MRAARKGSCQALRQLASLMVATKPLYVFWSTIVFIASGVYPAITIMFMSFSLMDSGQIQTR